MVEKKKTKAGESGSCYGTPGQWPVPNCLYSPTEPLKLRWVNKEWVGFRPMAFDAKMLLQEE